MDTVAYIKQYSQLYSDYKSNCPKELSDLDSVMEQYNYIETPSRSELPEQIELHMFWRIPLPSQLVKMLEFCIEQGVFFKRNPDAYYHVSEKYWPLVKYIVGASLVCREVKADDFTYSIELYKKAPLHFDLTEHNYNSLECLEQVHIHRSMERIISMECLMYVLKKGAMNDGMLVYLIEKDMIDCIESALALGFLNSLMDKILDICAEVGSIQCLKYFIRLGFYSSTATIKATRNGHLECLMYMVDRGYLLEGCMHAAAYGGHLNCIEYLHERGVPWGDSVVIVARNGYTRCLEYMCKYAPIRHDVMLEAAIRGHLGCIICLYKHGVPFGNSIALAARGGYLKCIKYMRAHGAAWGSAMSEAVCFGQLACIKYMHKEGLEFGDTMRMAAAKDFVHCVRYMNNHGAPRGRSISRAILLKSQRCLSYLRHNKPKECIKCRL